MLLMKRRVQCSDSACNLALFAMASFSAVQYFISTWSKWPVSRDMSQAAMGCVRALLCDFLCAFQHRIRHGTPSGWEILRHKEKQFPCVWYACCVMFVIIWNLFLSFFFFKPHLIHIDLFKQVVKLYIFAVINVFQNHCDSSPFHLYDLCLLWRFVGVN